MSEDDETLPRTLPVTKLLVGALVTAVVVTLVGFIGQMSGAGWFGHRAWLYGSGELYALNLGGTPLHISVDGQERLEVPAENAKVVDLVGGTSVVEVFDGDRLVATHRVTIDDSHAFLKLTDDGCLAVVDITPFYGGKQGKMLDFEAFLRRDARVWIAQSKNVVWPRRDFPSKLQGGQGKGLWFEIVACELFEEPKFLDAYLAIRVEQRMAAALGKKKNP